MEYKVSVIVPVYNGEQYINNCCEQLINQTLDSIEIIFIDDGSNDDSRNIIDSCERRYPNVMGLHQENKGVSAARNYGLSVERGKYIGFVDVDDNVDLDMFELLYTSAENNNLDVISMEEIGDEGTLTVYEKQEEWISALFQTNIKMSVCNKLFKKSLLQGEIFPVGKRIHEDLYAVYYALLKAKSVGSINVNKYYYVQHEGSSSRADAFTDKYFDAIEIAEWIYKDAIERFPNIKDVAEVRKANTYLRITKIYYLRKAPDEYRKRIEDIKSYLKSIPRNKLSSYFIRNDLVRYYLCLYAKPLFLLMIKTVDKK